MFLGLVHSLYNSARLYNCPCQSRKFVAKCALNMEIALNKTLQKLYFSEIQNDLDEDQAFAAKIVFIVYGYLAVVLNFVRLREIIQAPTEQAIFQLILNNLFLLGILFAFTSMPVFARYSLLRGWFIFNRELIAHIASRSRIPPSHWHLPYVLIVSITSLVTTSLRNQRQMTAHRPPHLNLRRKAPFLLFQHASLLAAP